MRANVDLQIRTNNALKTIERNKERELEYSQMVANQNELAMGEKRDREAKEFHWPGFFLQKLLGACAPFRICLAGR